ncbi:MAG: transporter substrate-binding domain-containing protein [Oscillospiraceae bacterium]|nr:transporter substrate-binding domain-containing protein [Oscillospiraceae bacterium]
MKKKFIRVFLAAALLASLLPGCSEALSSEGNNAAPGIYSDYREIPGVTELEVEEIERLKAQRDSFSYGMSLSTEAFLDENGNVDGFTALVCDWLSGLLGIEFIPSVHGWGELKEGLENGAIDFTGDIAITAARREAYYMTEAIAERQLIVVSSKGSPLLEVNQSPRYAFLEGSSSYSLVSTHQEDFSPLFAEDYFDAFEMLKSGRVDAIIAGSNAKAAFEVHEGLEINYLLPMAFAPVSLSTQESELAPVIAVVQKALDDGSIRHLVNLYNQGNQKYIKHKFRSLLSDEEREYIKNNPTIPVAIEPSNYPVSFYNNLEGQWQGIAIDMMDELEQLIGIKFEAVNSRNEEWLSLLDALETGRAAMVSELLYTKEREENFIWNKNKLFADSFVLISKSEHYDISVNEILYTSVGVVKGTAHGDLFLQWFPEHRHVTVYEDNPAAFGALERGEIDMLMSSRHQLLNLTNYREQVGYKANFIFAAEYESTFGFNKNYEVLCSIIDKGMGLIDKDVISGYWMRKTFDYRVKLARQRTVWMLGASAFFLILVFLVFLFFRKKSEGHRLERLVHIRTEELEEAIDAAEAANRSKSSFLASMSHEIRTPMNAVIGMLELLTHEPLNDRQMNYVSDIKHSAVSLLSIINDILDMSKIEAGKMELIPVDYDFMAFLDNIHSMFTYVAEEKGLEFKFETQGDLPGCLFGDDIRLRQIIINICGNAVKFTQRGYVELKVINAGDTMIFKISDSGRGIKQEDIEGLFSAFGQTDTVKNRNIAGTGLGLAICKSFAQMMHGTIEVESEYGDGSTFTVTIPLIQGDAEKLKAAVPKGSKLFAPKAKILVVDDNEFNLKVAVGLLKLSKINVETASSGALAVEMVQQTDYHIVFMDHMMPEMDGVETTAAIRALGGKYEKLAIIALTANAVQGSREFFLSNSFDDFLSKPIDVRELISLLKKWLPESLLEKASAQSAEAQEEQGGKKAEFLELLKGIDEINVKVGLKCASDEESLYYEAVEQCCKQLPGESSKMSSYLASGAVADFAIAVHGVKSVLATIGAVALSDNAFTLEKAAKNHNEVICNELFPDFYDNLSALHKKLLVIFPAKTAAEREQGDLEKLRQSIESALEYAREYDSDGGSAAVEPLLSFDYGEYRNTLLETAAKAFKEFDCESALKALDKVIQ